MAGQDFAILVDSGLLGEVEAIVVEGHRALWKSEGRPWSRPVAYHWLHYEDPAPVARLIDGVRRLRGRGARFNAGPVDNACSKASQRGFLN
jgi:hypothetical protein